MEMKRVMQTQFGTDFTAPLDEIGNCQQAAIASVLGLPLDSVPHFCGLYSDNEERYDKTTEWLASQGFASVSWDWDMIKPHIKSYYRLFGDSVFVTGGKSPRGDHQHAVIGRLTPSGGWELVHDPHPDGTGIVGEPLQIDILIARVTAP